MSRSNPTTVNHSWPSWVYGIVLSWKRISTFCIPGSSGTDNRIACPCCPAVAATRKAIKCSTLITLSPRGTREVKPLELNRWNVAGPAGPERPASFTQGHRSCECVHVGLREPQRLYSTRNLSVPNDIRAIAGLSRYDDVSRVDRPGVPKPRDIEPVFCRCDHFIHVRRSGSQKEVHRQRTDALGSRLFHGMSRRDGARLTPRSVAVVNDVSANAVFNDRHLLPWLPFKVERHWDSRGVQAVIDNRDHWRKDLLAKAAVQPGTFFLVRLRAHAVSGHHTQEIRRGIRVENDSVFARLAIDRILSDPCLSDRFIREFVPGDRAQLPSRCLCPSGRGRAHNDGGPVHKRC